MQTGFPSHMKIADIFTVIKQNLDMYKYACKNQKQFCNALLRSCGLKWRDFKIGSSKVFFRNGKLDMLTEKLKDDFPIIIDRFNKIKLLRIKWKVAIMVSIFCTIGKLKGTVATTIENYPICRKNSIGHKKIPTKKIKLDSNASTKTSLLSCCSKQLSGILYIFDLLNVKLGLK